MPEHSIIVEKIAELLWAEFDRLAKDDELGWEDMGESIREKYYEVASKIKNQWIGR